MYTYLRILFMYIISSSKNGGSLGSGHFDIAIMSNTRLFITSVTPWQNAAYVELLSQQSPGSHCYDSETLAFWVELQLDCQELWLVNPCELNHCIITFSKLVGRNYLNLCDATSLSRFYCKFSKSITRSKTYWWIHSTGKVEGKYQCWCFFCGQCSWYHTWPELLLKFTKEVRFISY